MIQAKDDQSIERLKKKLGAETKIEIVRAGLRLLAEKVERAERVKNWRKAAAIVAKSSHRITKEFQKHSRLKRA